VCIPQAPYTPPHIIYIQAIALFSSLHSAQLHSGRFAPFISLCSIPVENRAIALSEKNSTPQRKSRQPCRLQKTTVTFPAPTPDHPPLKLNFIGQMAYEILNLNKYYLFLWSYKKIFQ